MIDAGMVRRVEPLERARELFVRFEEQLDAELPAGAEVFDAHTHLGTDIDGTLGRYEELETILDRFGFSGCFMFCLDEPDRHPGFRAGNDRTLAFAERSCGRMIPFVRLDLSEDPIAEAERCLDRGARGIKLHPRAQKFVLDDERLSPVFALASERRVPILIHGGRGLPPIADHLLGLVDSYPGVRLIIAHAGIADLSGLAGNFSGKAGVFFDTSVWSALDLLGLLRLVPPEQILYASDYPYGGQPNSLLLSLRTARVAGLDRAPDRATCSPATRDASLSGDAPLEPSHPQGAEVLEQPMPFARIHQYLTMAFVAPLRPAAGLVRRTRPRAQRVRTSATATPPASSSRSASWWTARASCGAPSPKRRTRRRCASSRARPRASSISRTCWRSPRMPELRLDGERARAARSTLRSGRASRTSCASGSA